MGTVNLDLPEELQQFVNSQVELGEFECASQYIEALIERAKQGKDRLESLLIDGLDSGEPITLDAEQWSGIRAEVTDRLSDAK